MLGYLMGAKGAMGMAVDIPDEMLSILGKIVVSFSRLDHLITLIVGGSYLMEWPQVVELHKDPTANRVWLLQVFWAKRIEAENLEKFTALIASLTFLNGQRNRLIHDIWTLSLADNGHMLRIKLTKEFDIQKFPDTAEPYTLKQLEKLETDIMKAISELDELFTQRVYEGLEKAFPDKS